MAHKTKPTITFGERPPVDFSLARGVLFSGLVLIIAAVVLFLFSINTVTIVLSTLIGLTFIAIALTGAIAQVYRFEKHMPDEPYDKLDRADTTKTVLEILSYLIFWR